MKPHVLFAIVMAVGFILVGGCIDIASKNSANQTASLYPVTLFSNTTNPLLNKTVNTTRVISSDLKGSLRVSISGCLYPANLTVFLDSEPVGTVEPKSPLYLMVPEGNHTVIVCLDSVCEQETVTTRFGQYSTVDFSEQLQHDVKLPNPTEQPSARILDYYKNGNVVTVFVEFINPESKDHTFSADLSLGYTYIDGRSYLKLGDSAQVKTTVSVKAGQKETKRLDMYLVSNGQVLTFGNPVIEQLKVI
jgi:hypothetical protein